MKIIKREKSTSTKGHYVTNGQLLPAVIEAKQLGKVTTKLIGMIMKIAERYSRKHNFVGYSFREDMVSAAVMNLCNNALKFNPEKSSNPFSFYTTAIHNSFLQYMADEKKHRNIRDALLMDAGSNPSFNFMEKEKDESAFEIKESDECEIIERYEAPTIDDTAVPLMTTDSLVETVEPSARAKTREPGSVTRYSGNDIEIDPVSGNIKIKEKPVTAPSPKKRAAKPKATVSAIKKPSSKVTKETVSPKKTVKVKEESTAKTLKAVSTKKPSAKPVKPVKPVAKPATKKVAAKKVTAKAK